ncbi:MAG: HAD hydrolase-like protein, partial [Nitrospiraceae bacterium]|nr:HAD hydrolase-like protein [Nitrospiraceae bacterium]
LAVEVNNQSTDLPEEAASLISLPASGEAGDDAFGILEGLELAPYFDLVAGPETVAEKKPSAAPVLYVLDKLATDAMDAVMVGDSRFDIKAGRNAKVKCTVGVTYGYDNASGLKEADYVIGNIGELVATLYRNEPMLERRLAPRD